MKSIMSMDLENLFLGARKENMDFRSFLHELKPSPIKTGTYGISLASKTDCAVLIDNSHVDLPQHPFPVIDACIMGSQKNSSMEYSYMVLEHPQLDGLTDILRVYDVDIPAETHCRIRPYLALHDGREHII
jgi:hypothetical protein